MSTSPQGNPSDTSAAVDGNVHPGLRVISEVASYLAAGIAFEEVLTGVAGALRRGLDLKYCRVWIRTADAASFRPIVVPGDPDPSPEYARKVSEALAAGQLRDVALDGRHLRVPLFHEGEFLGLIEADLENAPRASTSREIVDVVAKILSPLLGSIELSEDLASEVAYRTREIESQRRFTAKIIDSLSVGLYVIDRDYRIQAWNRMRETGTPGVTREDAVGRSIFEVMYRQPRTMLKEEFDAVFHTGQIQQLEAESTASDKPRYFRITKIPMRLDEDEVTHVITIGEDITAWKSLQKEISQTEKLAAMGQLAAGVMHEINNPLATISACAEALTLRLPELHRDQRKTFDEYLAIVESELERCKSIVDGLLDFSRPKARLKSPVQVNQIVEEAIFLVQHHEKFKRITLIRRLAEDLPDIEVNNEQLIQVFLALMLNAIDALEGGGDLTVSTRMSPDRSDEVVVEFTDTGRGIPREEVGKIFEPFYTTKPPGQGTGLGLSICYGIVQQHGGRILVDSQVGRGSTFRVFLPIEAKEAVVR